MNELFRVDVPKSAQCPHYSNGRLVECHEHIPMKRRRGDLSAPRWKCKICRREIRWDDDYRVYVLPYLIEEVPW